MLARTAILAVTLSGVVTQAWGQGFIRDDFEGPEVSLRDSGGDAQYKVEGHQRVQQGAHSGRWCERLTLIGNNGTFVYFSHPIGPARVIRELMLTIWLKSDRPGLQILARVTLPRSKDPRSGKPLTTLISGSGYTQVGAWQQLRMENLPALLDRQVRGLRTKFGSSVDPREAYVDLLLINVYGGPDVTNVSIDDLEITGLVAPTVSTAEPASPDPATATISNLPTAWAGGKGVPKVELGGPLLLVGGKPFFPRAIEYQGEPLARLQGLGFNAVRLVQMPSPALLREAAALGLWLIAPPPSLRELEAHSAQPNATKIDEAFDPVLVWDLGSGLTSRDLEATKRWAKLVEAADPRRRPMICDTESELRAFTRPPVNLFLARRDALGTSLQLKEYASWLRERSQLVLPGTPLWATVQTQPSLRVTEQIGLLSSTAIPAFGFQDSQIRMLIRSALTAGARGLCFQSHSRLDADDVQTRRRAAILELLNLELDLIERWPASGNFAATASSNDPQAGGAVIETDRSRLLLPIFSPSNAQLVIGNPTVRPFTLKIPGVPEGNNAYEVSPTSTLRPLHSKRLAGGTQVVLSELERDSLIVFTQDELVMKTLRDRVAKMHERGAQLMREVAAAELLVVEAAEQRLSEVGRPIPATKKLRATAQNDLLQCNAFLAKKDANSLNSAYDQARHALQTLRDIERAHFEAAVASTDWALVDPFTTNFATLGEHYRFQQEIAAAPRGPTRLSQGDFEDLRAMQQAGWRNYEHPQPSVTTSVELTPQAAHAGRTGLRLQVLASDPGNKPAVLETPPVWVTSAAVQVEQGQILQISGWLRIPNPIVGSVDGLLIIDTLSSEAMALRVSHSAEWRQFTFYRGVPRAGTMAITFALAGLGEAWIDDVTIQVVQPPARAGQQAQRPRPPAGAPGGS